MPIFLDVETKFGIKEGFHLLIDENILPTYGNTN